MPLLVKESLNTLRYVQCRCGAKHPTYGDHYAHVGDCPVRRCAHCLRVIERDDDFDDHECPGITLMKLQENG